MMNKEMTVIERNTEQLLSTLKDLTEDISAKLAENEKLKREKAALKNADLHILYMGLLAGSGTSMLEYFKDTDIRQFSIWGSSEIANALALSARTENFKVYKRLGTESSKGRHFGFFVSTIEKYTDIVNYDRRIPIVIVEPAPAKEIATHLRKISSRVFYFLDMLQYAFDKGALINPLKNYLAENNLDVTVLLFGNAKADNVKNKSKYEADLMKKLGEFKNNRKDIHRVLMPQLIENSRLPYANEAYVRALASGYRFTTVNGVIALMDEQSEYRNSINGFRLTTDNPSNARNSVFFVGNSVCLGLCVEDKYTIQSALQRILNKHSECPSVGREYIVYNRSNSFADDKTATVATVKQLPVKNGDIIVLVFYFNKLTFQEIREKGNFLCIDSQPYFDRPHDMGEVFMDSRFHMSRIGYQKYAEIIFDALKNGGAFNRDSSCVNATSVSEQKEVYKEEEDPPELKKYISFLRSNAVAEDKCVGAIVMNCNPFTLGHLYLAEYAASKVDRLYIFVVEEDKSFFAFADRFEMVKNGVSHLPNVTVLPSGQFIISRITFEAYFSKDELQDAVIDPSRDIELFGQKIAPALSITVRFVGEEPLDKVTNQYNSAMKLMLPKYGVEVSTIPRKEFGGAPISASRVRKLLAAKDLEGISDLVPQTTLTMLKKKYMPVPTMENSR
jgi:[citrate (pro-3S)-lyase] ligase